jgi:hypothetical protein
LLSPWPQLNAEDIKLKIQNGVDAMIKPLHSPQLSAAKNRTGLQSIADLLPRLIRQYELQAELVKRRETNDMRRHGAMNRLEAKGRVEESMALPTIAIETVPGQQATFGWYE